MAAAEHRPPWFDPATPAREDCVLKAMLDVRAARHPERRFALFEDGSTWTYAECHADVRSAAAALQRLGVKKGDRVAAWLPTGRHMVLTWFAANYLGAVFVPLNTAYRGDVLAHVINSSGAAVMVAHHQLVPRLEGLQLSHLREVIAVGGSTTSAHPALTVLDESALYGDAAELDDSAEVDHWDIQSIIYTSGTTGYSKGVLSPYLQLYCTAMVVYGYVRDGESILVNLPMFHIGGTSPTYCALVRGGSIYLVDGFSTTKFWDQVRLGNCVTTSGLIGVMAAFLAKSEPRADDGDNPLRCMTMFPVNEETVGLARRYGFDYLTGFNMTEVSSPLVTDVNTKIYGSCGRPRSGMQCRLVDEHDVEVTAWHHRRDGRAQRHALDHERRLQRPARGDGSGLAQWLVPHGRPVSAGRRRQFLFRRSHQGHDPSPRREHLVVRGRERRAPVSGDRRSGRRRRGQRDRGAGGPGRGDVRSPGGRSIQRR